MMVLKFADHYITYTCHQSNGADSSTCDIPETVDKNWENLINSARVPQWQLFT